MVSGCGGEGRRAWRSAGRPRFGLGEMPQNRVDHVVLGDERDHLHLRAADRAHQRVDLVDPLDQLCPASPEDSGVADLVTSRTGGRADARTPNLPILSLRLPALAPTHVRVPPVVPHQVPPRLGDVHDDAGHELGRIEGLGSVAGR